MILCLEGVDTVQRGATDLLEDESDGGYYAIKGFLYQFDSTLMTILINPKSDINFEQVQDIAYEDYVIQVKHKETQTYSESKVRKPIIQLMNLFQKNNQKNILYIVILRICPYKIRY